MNKWDEEISNSGDPSDVESYISFMVNLNLANSIFIDCTASEAAIPYYQKILESNISITTPNKLANKKE